MTLALLVLGAAWAACPEPTDTADLDASLARARSTFQDLDIAAFKRATNELSEVVACLEDPLTAHLAAELHRYRGIRAFAERDTEARRTFAAARAIEPDYAFPPDLIPPGNPVLDAYTDFDLDQAAYHTVPEPSEGYMTFDGRPSMERPTSWPTVAQYFDGDGAVVFTRYLERSDAVPAYPVKQISIVRVEPDPGPQLDPDARAPSPLRTPLLVATGAAALTGVALYTAAGLSEAKFKDPDTPDAKLDGLSGRANALAVSAGVAGGAALGLGVAVAITW